MCVCVCVCAPLCCVVCVPLTFAGLDTTAGGPLVGEVGESPNRPSSFFPMPPKMSTPPNSDTPPTGFFRAGELVGLVGLKSASSRLFRCSTGVFA